MWKCKYCQLIFEFEFNERNKKANHTRWCDKNPASSKSREFSKSLHLFSPPISDEHKKKLSESAKQHIKKFGSNWVGRSHSQDTKVKIAIKLRGNNNGKHRGDRQSYYKDIRMDSSWEVKVAAYLDQCGICWEYGKTVFPLDDKRSYRPDFILSDGSIIEVKGYWRTENKLKFEEWKLKYPNVKFEVWDKQKLLELKIL